VGAVREGTDAAFPPWTKPLVRIGALGFAPVCTAGRLAWLRDAHIDMYRAAIGARTRVVALTREVGNGQLVAPFAERFPRIDSPGRRDGEAFFVWSTLRLVRVRTAHAVKAHVTLTMIECERLAAKRSAAVLKRRGAHVGLWTEPLGCVLTSEAVGRAPAALLMVRVFDTREARKTRPRAAVCGGARLEGWRARFKQWCDYVR